MEKYPENMDLEPALPKKQDQPRETVKEAGSKPKGFLYHQSKK